MRTRLHNLRGVGLVALLAAALLAVPAVGWAKEHMDKDEAVQPEKMDKDKGDANTDGEKMARCKPCQKMAECRARMEKISELLADAKESTESASLEDATVRIAEAQELLAEQREAMRQMKQQHKKMHMKDGKMDKNGMHKNGMHEKGMHGKAGAKADAEDGKVVNARCPIMGSKLDPDSVSASLTREFNGKKVGFCCAGCPKAWDKLDDEAKEKKLEAAMTTKDE